MQSHPFKIPYDRLLCWTKDSLMEIASFEQAELKLVHYIEPDMCSSCYLSKVLEYKSLFDLERESDKQFLNVFIVEPGKKNSNIRKLSSEYNNGVLPPTIFVDTSHAFVETNPNIPKEFIYHTFLIDKNGNVILVGNPIINKKIKEKISHIVRRKKYIYQ